MELTAGYGSSDSHGSVARHRSVTKHGSNIMPAFAVALAIVSCAVPSPHAIADTTVDAKALYQTYCTQCHGINANGNGINAASMSVQPRDHTDETEMATRSDEELFKVIQLGGKSINKSILMPAWGDNMSDEQIHAMVRHLRGLCCEK